MVSFTTVESYQSPVSKKSNKNIKLQKKYRIQNNNPENPSTNLTQTVCKSIHISTSLEVLYKKTGYDTSLHNRIK